MQNKKIENQIEFLLLAALQKCGNIHDAEDLTQEPLLTALSHMAKGNAIGHMRAWLLTVLDHKWNDFLRKKYRQPIVGIGEGVDLVDEEQRFWRPRNMMRRHRCAKRLHILQGFTVRSSSVTI